MKTPPANPIAKKETSAQKMAGDRRVARAFAGQWPAADNLHLMLESFEKGAGTVDGIPSPFAFLDVMGAGAKGARTGRRRIPITILHDQAVTLNALGQYLLRQALRCRDEQAEFEGMVTLALNALAGSREAAALLLTARKGKPAR